MKELYVNDLTNYGQKLVMVYVSAQRLADYIAPQKEPWPEYLGTLSRDHLTKDLSVSLDRYGYILIDMKEFDTLYRSKLVCSR